MEVPKSWLLLLYGLPAKSSSERVNLWRKLKKFGAVQLKNSAYVLPDTATHFERFQWLAKQVRDNKGDATLIRVTEVEGLTGDQIADVFRDSRRTDYEDLNKKITAASKRKRPDAEALDGLRQRFNEIREIDYFSCPAAHDVELALRRLEETRSWTNVNMRDERGSHGQGLRLIASALPG
jgi:CRISPR/Cas system-associated endoribonuclease Cas2